MKDELKACPFCGHNEIIILTPAEIGDIYNVRCQICYAERCSLDRETAIKAWNTRPTPSNEEVIELFCNKFPSGKPGLSYRKHEKIKQWLKTVLNRQVRLPEKLKLEYTCLCDCIPCKTDSCEKCNLGDIPNQLMRNGEMCREGDNSDWVEPYNAAIDKTRELNQGEE